MKHPATIVTLTAGLLLIAGNVHAIDVDDFDVTMEVIENDQLNSDEILNRIELPRAAAEIARERSRSGLDNANAARAKERGHDESRLHRETAIEQASEHRDHATEDAERHRDNAAESVEEHKEIAKSTAEEHKESAVESAGQQMENAVESAAAHQEMATEQADKAKDEATAPEVDVDSLKEESNEH